MFARILPTPAAANPVAAPPPPPITCPRHSTSAALTRPAVAASLLLAAPAGSLLSELTPSLRAFIDQEQTALDDSDLDAAVAANLSWWVDGPHREPAQVGSGVRELVGLMQRRAFEVTGDWDDGEEQELEPPALGRLGEISVPALVLIGGLDLDAVHDAAARVTSGIAGARRVDWPEAGHLPSLERPADFLNLLRQWTTQPA